MRLFNQLNSASFRGIPFLFNSHEMQGGRKVVIHEFPNKNTRYVEDLGGLQKTFNVKGIISEPNYKLNRDALITALDSPGIGILIHPLYGTRQVVLERYRTTESMTHLGRVDFEMTFQEAAENIFPIQSGNNASLINQLASLALFASQFSMSDLWDVNNKFRINYQNAQSILNMFTTILSGIPDPFNSTPKDAAIYQQQLTTFSNSITSIINNSPQLASEITNLFFALDVLTIDATERIKSAQKLFNYGQNVPFTNTSTFPRRQRIQNNKALYSQINFSALINAYNAAAQINYISEEDLISTETILDNQFYYAIDNTIFDENAIDALKSMRNQLRIFFEANRINIRKIIVVVTQQTTLTNLTYAYYNSLDNDTLISNLNNMRTPNNISGDIRIVTNK